MTARSRADTASNLLASFTAAQTAIMLGNEGAARRIVARALDQADQDARERTAEERAATPPSGTGPQVHRAELISDPSGRWLLVLPEEITRRHRHERHHDRRETL